MNAKKLKELSEKNETAKRILSMVGDRRRNTVFTAFSGLRADLKKRDGKEVNRADFDSTFEALEKMEAGKLQKTAKGTLQGFSWAIPIREVGQAIREPSEKPAKVRTILKSAKVSEEVTPNVPYVSSDKTDHRPATIVILRKGKGAETFETDEDHATSVIKSLSI